MMALRLTLTVSIALIVAQPLMARPLLTEEVPTIGKKAFETTFSISERRDKFNTPESTYRSVNFPFSARFGLSRSLDLGLYLLLVNHRLETPEAQYSGSNNGRISPFLKFSPWDYMGLMVIYHGKNTEEIEQELPIGFGKDWEFRTLFKMPTFWPISFNINYVMRGAYDSKFGVRNPVPRTVRPGNIFETRGAVEIPLKHHFSILGEMAYYSAEKSTIQGVEVANSSAEAMDGLIGLTWSYFNWYLSAGAAVGLLDEKDTSFNLERGAGDGMIKLSVTYRLTPKKTTP